MIVTGYQSKGAIAGDRISNSSTRRIDGFGASAGRIDGYWTSAKR